VFKTKGFFAVVIVYCLLTPHHCLVTRERETKMKKSSRFRRRKALQNSGRFGILELHLEFAIKLKLHTILHCVTL